MTAPVEARPAVRIALAKSLLQREPCEQTCEIAIMALRGARVEQIHAYLNATSRTPEPPVIAP